MTKINIGDRVSIRLDWQGDDLKIGDTGVVWCIYDFDPPDYEVCIVSRVDGEWMDIMFYQEEVEYVSSPYKYAAAVPVLLHALRLEDYLYIEDSIKRLFRSKASRQGITSGLIVEFLSIGSDRMDAKWQIAATLCEIASDSLFDQIVPMIVDANNGMSRQMLVKALGKMKRRNEEASDLAATVITDPELTGHAINALGRLKAVRFRQLIEPYLLSKNAWHKREAQTAIRKMDKAAKIIDENSNSD